MVPTGSATQLASVTKKKNYHRSTNPPWAKAIDVRKGRKMLSWRDESDEERLLPGEPGRDPRQVIFTAANRVKSITAIAVIFDHQVLRALVSLELPAGLMAFSYALHSIIATNLYLDKVATVHLVVMNKFRCAG